MKSCLIASAVLMSVSTIAFGQNAAPADRSVRCAALSSLSISAAQIGLPTKGAVIESASFVVAGAEENLNGEFCKVLGLIKPVDPAAPDIEVEVNLPSVWNSRALQMGGGGYDGSLVTGLTRFSNAPVHDPTPLASGYVTLGGDSGHKAAGFNGAFALNDEAWMNFGSLSVKKTHDAAMVVVKAYYGRLPKYMYFIGGSQGGHEALIAAALYPADYNGVVANYPAYDITLLQLSGVGISQALYKNGGAGWLNPAKMKMLSDAVYAVCDKLDGAVDGIISDTAACKRAFTIDTVRSTLRCVNGEDTGDNCLSDAQIASVDEINSPYSPGYTIAGATAFPRWPILEGALFSTNGTLGSVKQPASPPSGKEAFQYSVAAGITKYFITRDPSFDPLTFEPSAWKAQAQHSGEVVDISNADLHAFQAKGGKILMAHGTIDDLISPYNSIDYYNRELAAFGQAKLDSFLRFYILPGLGHGRGLFNATYDSLGVLDAWVREGKAPGTLTTFDGNAGANRSRPMCVYPGYPKFSGAPGASLDAASNFTCARH